MAFALSLLYILFTLVPPAEIVPELAPYNVMDVLGLLALVASLLGVIAGRRPHLKAPQVYLLGGLVLWAMLSVVLAEGWFGGAVETLHVLAIRVFVFLLIVLNVDTRPRLAVVRWLILVCVWAFAVLGWASYVTDWEHDRFIFSAGPHADLDADEASEPPTESSDAEEVQRPQVRRLKALGFLDDPNQFAQMLVASVPLLWLSWRGGRPFRNAVFVFLPAVPILVAIGLTKSRGGLVALAVLATFVIWQRARGPIIRGLILFSGLAMFPAFFLMERQTLLDDSAMGRVEAWSYGLQLLKMSPVWGSGFGTFIEGSELTAHNSFVLCFAELGLVGYSLWLGLLVVTILQLGALSREHREGVDPEVNGYSVARWAAACRASLAGFLAAAFFLSRTYSVLFFTLIGLSTAIIAVARNAGYAPRPLDFPRTAGLVLGIEAFSVLFIYLAVRLVR